MRAVRSDVSGLLQAGENAIRIVVANTALNVMAKGPLPDYKALTAKYGERFQAQDMQAVPRSLRGCSARAAGRPVNRSSGARLLAATAARRSNPGAWDTP